MEAAARAEAARLVLEKQLQQEADLQQVTCCPIPNTCLPCLASVKMLLCCVWDSAAWDSCPARQLNGFRVLNAGNMTEKLDSESRNACVLQDLKSQSRLC